MENREKSSHFQEVIDSVESLPEDDQVLLIEILNQRLSQGRRLQLIHEVAEARRAYADGRCRSGSVEDLLEELGE